LSENNLLISFSRALHIPFPVLIFRCLPAHFGSQIYKNINFILRNIMAAIPDILIAFELSTVLIENFEPNN